ncbi:MAG: hypothetical protein ACRD3W_17320, partial [Terriglobales bacterium]
RWGVLELGREALRRRDFVGARHKFEAMARIAHNNGDARAEARSLTEAAYVCRLQGDLPAADRSYKQAYAIWKQLRPSWTAGAAEYTQFLLDYAAFLRVAGHHFYAFQIESRVEKFNPETQTPYFQMARAELFESRGHDCEAEKLFEQALIDSSIIGDLELQLRACDRLHALYKRRGKQFMARHILEQRAAIARCKSTLIQSR